MADLLKYDDIQLSIGAKRSVSIDVVPTPDGRQTNHHRISIEVEALVMAGTGDTIDDVRRKLTRNGGHLVAQGIGIGFDLDVNGSGTQKDLLGGPSPKLIRFNPLAAQSYETAIEVTWQIEVNIFIESTSGASLEEITNYSYGMTYALDNGGWTTRTISGLLTCRQKFSNPNRILHNVDQYRDQIHFIKPEGYERIQTYEVSDDKATLRFSITDKQIKTRQPYPPGVIEIDAIHRVQRSRSQMAITLHTINVRVEVAADQPTVYAWFVFQQIALKRINHARYSGIEVLIDEIEVEEEIFGVGVSASITYRTLNDLSTWLANSGMFQPIQQSWDAWEQSLHHIEESRGLSNLEPDPIAQDRLVNLENGDIPYIEDKHHPHIDATAPTSSALCNGLPDPEKSWAHFEAYFEINQSALERDHWIPIGPEALEDGKLDLNELGGAGRGSRTEVASIIAKNPGYPTRLIYRGMAIRVGYEIPIPRIEIPGVKTSMIDKQFKPVFLGIFYCQPVFAAKWVIQYQIGDLPVGIKPGVNPDGTYTGGSGVPGSSSNPPAPPNNP